MLQIDIEGFDAEVLLSTDFTDIFPQIIRYESIHIEPYKKLMVKAHLAKYGYDEIADPYYKYYKELGGEELEEFNTVFKRRV